MTLTEERLRSIVESVLLVSAEPVPFGRILEVIRAEHPGVEESAVSQAIAGLVARYEDAERPVGLGFRVEDLGGAFQLRTVADNAPFVRSFLTAKPQRLSKAALETLAIIAYRQPVTKPEVEAIRGVDSGAVLKQLLERDLVRIIGKRDEIGRPIIYGTTKAFLEFFGIRSLSELPTLREYHELDEEHQEEVDALGGAPEKGQIADLAAAATFLMEVEDDPDLDSLDEAVQAADRVRRVAELALEGKTAEAAVERTRPAEKSVPEDGEVAMDGA